MKKQKHLGINLQAAKIAKMKQAGQQTANNKAQLPKQKKTKAAADVNIVSKPKPAAEVALQTAKLVVEFRNVDAGLSDFTATHNGAEQTIHESDTISFNNVKTNDTILIKGDSAGSTNVKITGVTAEPMQMDFDAGQHIGGLFFIIS
jgi:hypothetical protein